MIINSYRYEYGWLFSKFNYSLLVVAVSAGIVNHNAWAQGDDIFALEEIVVTAQKREESLQDVPISVSAMSGEQISDVGAQRFEDVANYIPNFSVTRDPIGDKINIRGIQSGNQAGFEQSVGTFVDGVYRGRGVMSRFAFLDIGMVEVLRGPQGTLFGKNTVAGAMNIRSARPTDEFEGEISASYNIDFDTTELTGFVSGSLSESVKARLAFLDRQMDEGWIDNQLLNEDVPQTDEQAARLTFEWDASDSTSIIFRWEHGEWDNRGQNLDILEAGGNAAVGVVGNKDYKVLAGNNNTAATDFYTAAGGLGALLAPTFSNSGPLELDTDQEFDGEIDEVSVTIDHELANGSVLTVIGAYSEYDFVRKLDADFAPSNFIRFDDTEDQEQKSFEVRLASDTGGEFEHISGLYYQENELFVEGVTLFNLDYLTELVRLTCGAQSANVTWGQTTPDAVATVTAVSGGGATSAAQTNACAQLGLLYGLNDSGGNPAPASTPGPSDQGGVNGATRYAFLDQESDTWAAFTQITWKFTEGWRGSLGLRYTEEKKEATHGAGAVDYDATAKTFITNPVDPRFAAASIVGELGVRGLTPVLELPDRDEESFTWSINLQHDLNEDTMLYGSVSTGFKAGGYNSFFFGTDTNNSDYEEEEVLTFEVGAKMTLLSGSAEMNVAVFQTEYDDLQASVFTGGTTFEVQNAAEATTRGIEIDGRWQAMENLLLTLSVGYLDFEFDSFSNQACTSDQFQSYREAAWSSGAVPLASLLNNGDCADAGINDLKGKTSESTPEWSSTFSATHTLPVGDFELVSRMDIVYADEMHRQGDLDENVLDDSYTKIHLTFIAGPQSGVWDVSLIAQNVTDETSFTYANDTPLTPGAFQGALDAPRNVAVRARLRF
jgi:iron complex outermembrane recepter protein